MNEYVTISTEVKVGEKTVDKAGKEVKEATKESISFLVPKLSFFAQAVNADFHEASTAVEAGYDDTIAAWLFDAIISKCRQTLTSRITTDGEIAYKSPYKAWTNFQEMVTVLGQRGRAGKDALIKAFVADYSAFILGLGKSEKYSSDRIKLCGDKGYLAAQSEAVRTKFAESLAAFWATSTDEQKVKHEEVFGDLVSICSGANAIEDLSDE